jgi:hypothetical protein
MKKVDIVMPDVTLCVEVEEEKVEEVLEMAHRILNEHGFDTKVLKSDSK